jgi:GNAT superfamily N-acetyltransferase
MKVHVRFTTPADPASTVLLADLADEYTTRYGPNDEMHAATPDEFAPPGGAFVLLALAGEVIAGGGFRSHEPGTAEVKRVWTHRSYRRRGLARRVLAELEAEARRRGYRRLYLFTGPRQPEAVGLYLATGYRPLFDPLADPETIGQLRFEKYLSRS